MVTLFDIILKDNLFWETTHNILAVTLFICYFSSATFEQQFTPLYTRGMSMTRIARHTTSGCCHSGATNPG